MKFEKNEIRTGLLVLFTVGVLLAVLLLLGAPGLFHKQKRYKVFFDNAAGVKPGATVLLAGRKIGQVTTISSPVPKALRPEKAPEAEVSVDLTLERDARVYRDAVARMSQLGLLGEQIIDFVEGNESAGVADDGYTFVGERTPDFSESIPRIIRVLEPVASTATLTLDDLRRTVGNLNVLIDREGPLVGTLNELRQVGGNFAEVTAKDGALQRTLANVQELTSGLNDKNSPLQASLHNLQRTTEQLAGNGRLEKTLANFQETSRRAEVTLSQANALLAGLKPSLAQSASNFAQMTDTLKRQPWRLVWPSTKVYDQGPAAGAPAAAPDTIVVRKRARRTAE